MNLCSLEMTVGLRAQGSQARTPGPQSSIPELAGLPEDERRRIWRHAVLKSYRRWQTWVWLVVYVTAQMLTLTVGRWYLGRLGSTVAYFASVPVLAVLFIPIWKRYAIRYVREAVGGYCVKCGYDLRATPARCPECGVLVTPAGKGV